MVTVRELTFADVRDWLRRREILKSCDVIHALAFEDFGIDDLAEMSDATTEEMEACAPSELKPLIEACKALNPHFSARGRPGPGRPRHAGQCRAADLDRSACILVTHGHAGCGVTWSAYLAAVALANESTQSAKAR